MENKIVAPPDWQAMSTAPLPADPAAQAANEMQTILDRFPIKTQILIMRSNLFRLVWREQDVELLSYFAKDLDGRYRAVAAGETYLAPRAA